MEVCRARKAACEVASESWLRETVMSTMLPEEMEGGRRIEGNSIWRRGLVGGRIGGRKVEVLGGWIGGGEGPY